MWIEHAPLLRDLTEINLLSYDAHAFPFQTGMRLEMNAFPPGLGYVPPVLALGEPGSVDSGNISYYGTVCKVGEEYWMWYLANDDSGTWHQRLCLAISRDGKNWNKPNLGIYEHNGSTDNNVCDLPVDANVQACVIFYEPDDPDPSRVFKMSFESSRYGLCQSVAFSTDGIHWVPYEGNPVGRVLYEQAGGIKHNGMYYVMGQAPLAFSHYSPKGARRLDTYCSPDFIHWSPATCSGFSRDPMPPKTVAYGYSNGPQVHLGAGMWDRGNVAVGFYGMWDGHPSDDRNLVCMHLGLVVTHDCLHFDEPVPDFPIVRAGEMKMHSKARPHFPALMQGQGCYNIGDETVFWFGLWPEADSNGVRAATWPKDRLGQLQTFVRPDQDSFVITDRLHLEDDLASLYLNVDGLHEHSDLRVSVVGDDFLPVPGYEAEACVRLTENGFRVPVRWQNHAKIESGHPVRLRFDFGGVRPEDIRLYAAYIEK